MLPSYLDQISQCLSELTWGEKPEQALGHSMVMTKVTVPYVHSISVERQIPPFLPEWEFLHALTLKLGFTSILRRVVLKMIHSLPFWGGQCCQGSL